MTTYDDWKTTNPADEELGPEPPPCERPFRFAAQHPRFPSGDCTHCGALATEGCKDETYAAWEREQTGDDPDRAYDEARDRQMEDRP